MAKQAGHIKIEGRRIGKLVFYKMRGEYYVRTKSSLSGKRVKKDPKFRRTMRSAGELGRASKIGSVVYNALPKEKRQFWMYRAFTGEAMMMIKQGMIESEILAVMMKRYAPIEHENNKQGILKNESVVNRERGVKYEVRNTKGEPGFLKLGITSRAGRVYGQAHYTIRFIETGSNKTRSFELSNDELWSP